MLPATARFLEEVMIGRRELDLCMEPGGIVASVEYWAVTERQVAFVADVVGCAGLGMA